jgi:hypothetical protein
MFGDKRSMSNEPRLVSDETVVLHELVSLFDQLPQPRRMEAARFLLDVCRGIDGPTIDSFTIMKCGAQITVETYSKFID